MEGPILDLPSTKPRRADNEPATFPPTHAQLAANLWHGLVANGVN
jgi:hypothetical protein